ncbi:TPA: hypothetical protein TVE90_000875 [Streptococcus equi subsp. zooepidemicus]|nr:hypothetical protein [Streptococcus equi subsp. zooepidemicus]
MKKKLVMILTLYLSTYAMNVSADKGIEFLQIPQQQIPEVTVEQFKVGDSIIKIHTPQFWYVDVYRGDKKVETEYECRMENVGYSDNPIDNPIPQYPRYYSGSRSDQWGNYEIQLKIPLQTTQTLVTDESKCPKKIEQPPLPLKKGEKLTFVFADEDNWEVGRLVYKDSLTLKEEQDQLRQEKLRQHIEKEQKHVEQKLLEDNMLKHIRENDHKTWYQRLGDSIEDTWANVKGWWKG